MANDQKIDAQPSQHLLWWQTGVIYQIYPRSYALNSSDEEHQVSMPTLGDGTIVVSTHLDRIEAVDLEKLVLRSDEGVIVELSEQ